MKKVLLADLKKLDATASISEFQSTENFNEIDKNDPSLAVLPVTRENLKKIEKNDQVIVYIPAEAFREKYLKQKNIRIYFDLENYPFYKSAKSLIEQEQEKKGVFRYRRTVKSEKGLSLLPEDLFVIAKLFGKSEKMSMKQTDLKITPSHTIVTANFRNGTMAHIEYTMTEYDRIELEWSGVKNIIEFDSFEMSPIQPVGETKLPLLYTVDSLIENAYQPDDSFLKSFNEFASFVNGGVE